MRNHHSAGAAPLAIGTGLVALDVVITAGDPRPAQQWVGGTCGNVMLALRYLGWHSAPVARLSEGQASTRVLADLRAWGVSTEFVTVGDDGSTPVIVHRIGRTVTGEPYHTFSWRCPNCGTRLPGYKPVLASAAERLIDRLDTAQVFFFDRASRGALVLARAFAARGAAVLFEPSAVGNPVLFREAWQLAHIVKYSHERLHDLPADLEESTEARLQIETLGQEGLRYRSRLPGSRTRTWRRLDALAAESVKDSAGSGDWCTTGIIHRLLRCGRKGLMTATDSGLSDALRYGQALAAWNCGFQGARGGMYSVSKEMFEQHVERIIKGESGRRTADGSAQSSVPYSIASLCPSCEETESQAGRPKHRGVPATAKYSLGSRRNRTGAELKTIPGSRRLTRVRPALRDR